MNVETGHLMMLDENEVAPEGYDLVPLKLQMEAMRRLDGQKETIVDLKEEDGLLSEWAMNKRASVAKKKSQKEQRKKKVVKESKRQNWR